MLILPTLTSRKFCIVRSILLTQAVQPRCNFGKLPMRTRQLNGRQLIFHSTCTSRVEIAGRDNGTFSHQFAEIARRHIHTVRDV